MNIENIKENLGLAFDNSGSWNYRVRETTYVMPEDRRDKYIKDMKEILGEDYEVKEENFIDTYYDIIEVYYDDKNNIVAWSDDSQAPWRK